MLDVVDRRRQAALKGHQDAARHLLGRQPGVLPGNRDHRDPDLGEDVGRHAQGSQRANDQHQQSHHHEGIGPLQRNADDAYQQVELPVRCKAVSKGLFNFIVSRPAVFCFWRRHRYGQQRRESVHRG